MLIKSFLGLLCLCCCSNLANGWTTDDLALYDLVEDVKDHWQLNFYEIYDVAQNVPLSDIKRIYRRLSLRWHPDKCKEAETDVCELRFRHVASIYEIFKSEELRKTYDDVLEFGLPDWRQPVFYYRSVRKMPWWESAGLLFLIITVGHFLMLWGAYVEQKLTLQGVLESRMKKNAKKLQRKHNIDVNDLIEEQIQEQLSRPSVWELLPFVFGRWIINLCISIPVIMCDLLERLTKKPEPLPEYDETVVRRPVTRIEQVEYDIATDVTPVSTSEQMDFNEENNKEHILKTGTRWSVDEMEYLVRLTTNKFPVGTPNRWDQIAAAMDRNSVEVTAMTGKLKHMDPKEYQKFCDLTNASFESDGICAPIIDNSDSDAWSQTEQKLLETALQQFPKGTDERWEKIAERIPGKSKEQCMQRFKELAQLVRKRKQGSGTDKC